MKYTKKTKAELRIEKAKEELELVRKAHDDLEYIYTKIHRKKLRNILVIYLLYY
jgi:hypothetical protein